MQNHTIKTTELMRKMGLGKRHSRTSSVTLEKKDMNLIKQLYSFVHLLVK